MKRIFSILIISLIISIINIVGVFAKDIHIKELNEDKSIILLDENNNNSEIIDKMYNIILINDKGNIISVPKEYYINFKEYRLLGYENNNVYYRYSSAKKLINEICDSIINKRKLLEYIFMIIVIIIELIIGIFIVKLRVDDEPELATILTVILGVILCIVPIGLKYIDNLNFEKSTITLIEEYIEPREFKEYSKLLNNYYNGF